MNKIHAIGILCTSLFIFGCQAPANPYSLQGQFESLDGTMRLETDSGSATLTDSTGTYKADTAYTDFDSIFTALSAGQSGVYITPRLIADVLGSPVELDPFQIHSDNPSVGKVYSADPTLKDYFLLFKAVVAPVTSGELGTVVAGQAYSLLVSWDDKDSSVPSQIQVTVLPAASITTSSFPGGRLWAIGQGNDAEKVAFIRQ